MVSIKSEAKLNGREIFRVDAPFDQALSKLRSFGMRFPIKARDLAENRIQLGKSNAVSRYGSYTKEGFVYAKGEPVLLALHSPLLRKELAEKAVKANRRGEYFSTPDLEAYEKLRNQAEEDKNKAPEMRKVIILSENTNFDTSRTSALAKGLLKDKTDDYFDFINRDSIKTYLVNSNTVNNQSGTLLTQLWFNGLDYGGSGLIGSNRDLDCDDGVRGVKLTGEAGLQFAKQVLPYTSKDLDKYFKIVQGVREGNIPASRLENVLSFLGGLMQQND